MLMSAGGVVVVGLFVFLMHQADTHPPAQHEMRIDVPVNGSN
jgi:hypothetical protein